MELNLVTYNIHKGIGNDRAYRLDRIIEVCRDLKPDIVAMQEVPHASRKSRNEDSARMIADALEMEYVLGINVRMKRGSYGNATFSRYPIGAGHNLNITWSIKKPRGCLNAVVRLPGNLDLAVMNFHLGLAGIERRRQIRSILASHFMAEHGSGPLVLLGDTNDMYKIGCTGFSVGPDFRDITRGQKNARTFPAYAPIWKLDRIYHNGAIEILEHSVLRTKLSRMASDHLPLFVRLRLNSGDA